MYFWQRRAPNWIYFPVFVHYYFSKRSLSNPLAPLQGGIYALADFLYAFISFTFQGWIRYQSFCSGRTPGMLVKTMKYLKFQIILVIPVCKLTLLLTLPSFTLPYLTLPYLTLHYLTSYHTLLDLTLTLPCLTLPYILPYLTIPYVLPYLTLWTLPLTLLYVLPYRTLNLTLSYFTLPYLMSYLTLPYIR